MKTLVTILLAFVFFNCLAQQTKRASSFKAITYNNDGSIWNTREELIKDNAAVYDLYFIAKNFYSIPLPTSISSDQYKSQKVETSTGNNAQTKRMQNLVYDEFGRVKSYGQSGCKLCSDLGYQYNVHYNVNNKVDTLSSAPTSIGTPKKYAIRYSQNDDVKQIDCFVAGRLAVQILLF